MSENKGEWETEEEKQEKNQKENEPRLRKKRKNNKSRWLNCFLASVLVGSVFFAGFCTARLCLDSEMRALLRLKNRMQNSYYREVSDEEFYQVVFDAINEELLDEYSKYMTADEYKHTKDLGRGEQSGVGLVFSTQTAQGEPQMRVVRVCGNSPAESKGIRAGDRVIGFGATKETMQQSQVFQEFSHFLSAYEEGETFFVQFENAGVVSLSKAAYVENYVFYRDNQKGYSFTGENASVLTQNENALSCLNEETAYIRLAQFNGSAAEEFSQAMSIFKQAGKKNLVLDLRGNGGGYLNIMREIASYFCKGATEKKPVVAIADYGENKEIFRAKDNLYGEYFSEDSRICVLADNGTASASECLMGCMLDYGAISFGDICLSAREGIIKTFGKGIMQTTYPLSVIAGDAVKLTTARICWPKSETCIHGVGILPQNGTKTVEENYQGDLEINAAISLLF